MALVDVHKGFGIFLRPPGAPPGGSKVKMTKNAVTHSKIEGFNFYLVCLFIVLGYIIYVTGFAVSKIGAPRGSKVKLTKNAVTHSKLTD